MTNKCKFVDPRERDLRELVALEEDCWRNLGGGNVPDIQEIEQRLNSGMYCACVINPEASSIVGSQTGEVIAVTWGVRRADIHGYRGLALGLPDRDDKQPDQLWRHDPQGDFVFFPTTSTAPAYRNTGNIFGASSSFLMRQIFSDRPNSTVLTCSPIHQFRNALEALTERDAFTLQGTERLRRAHLSKANKGQDILDVYNQLLRKLPGKKTEQWRDKVLSNYLNSRLVRTGIPLIVGNNADYVAKLHTGKGAIPVLYALNGRPPMSDAPVATARLGDAASYNANVFYCNAIDGKILTTLSDRQEILQLVLDLQQRVQHLERIVSFSVVDGETEIHNMPRWVIDRYIRPDQADAQLSL